MASLDRQHSMSPRSLLQEGYTSVHVMGPHPLLLGSSLLLHPSASSALPLLHTDEEEPGQDLVCRLSGYPQIADLCGP